MFLKKGIILSKEDQEQNLRISNNIEVIIEVIWG